MTVKGLNFSNFTKQAALMGDESIVSSLKHNGANNGSSRDSNLNPYKLSQVIGINARALQNTTLIFNHLSVHSHGLPQRRRQRQHHIRYQ